MKKHFGFLFILMTMTSCSTLQNTKKIPVTADFQREVDFIPHTADKPFGSYLSMNLPYEPFQQIREQLEQMLGKKLTNRDEAHITVITPPEYDVLKSKINIQEINQIAMEMHLQKSKYKPLCIGQGELKLNNQFEQTYYVVVASEALFAIRQKIEDIYVLRGGQKNNFRAEVYYPHVTLGFTLRDLHYEDGVIKDATSCRFEMKDPDAK